jgi:hypothetical protein
MPGDDDLSDGRVPTQLDLALQYASLGLQIVPAYEITSAGVCSCHKGAECKAAGKHPRPTNGVNDASLDPNVITRWFTTWPRANIALACGAANNVFVVDIDPRHGGFGSIDEFESERGDFLPATLTALTGGGGKHLFFRYPTDGSLGNRIGWLPGVDVKSDGGIVILPQSNHISGRNYQWLDLEIPIATAPSDLVLSIRGSSAAGTKGELADSATILDGVPEGQRDDTLFRWACRLRRQHSGDADGGRAVVTALVLAVARKSNFPEDEALVKVEQAFRQEHDGLTEAQQLWVEFAMSNVAFRAERKARVRPGGSFILDEPDQIPAVWGDGERVLWAEGEGLMITGHQGVGKTTVAQQLVLARLGIRGSSFLGLPVARSKGRVVYLAMDRPRQAARSFRRMVSEFDRAGLDAQLVVWRGPLPCNPLDGSEALADFIDEICEGADTVVIDSVKDLAPGISKDEVGAALNSAWQEIIARDIELLLLHHERKAPTDSKRTHKLDDVYGSTWLTSGLGSVIVLDGDPGDPTLELVHLKQPADPVGPLKIRHDHTAGLTVALESLPTVVDLVNMAGDVGLTKFDLAAYIFGRTGTADLQRAGRQLNKLVDSGLARKILGVRTAMGAQPDRWVATSASQRAGARGLSH